MQLMWVLLLSEIPLKQSEINADFTDFNPNTDSAVANVEDVF